MSNIKEINDKDLENIAGGLISFEPLRKVMEERGISTYTLQSEYNFDPKDLNRLVYNTDYTVKMVKRLCEMLNLKPSDIIEIVRDGKK